MRKWNEMRKWNVMKNPTRSIASNNCQLEFFNTIFFFLFEICRGLIRQCFVSVSWKFSKITPAQRSLTQFWSKKMIFFFFYFFSNFVETFILRGYWYLKQSSERVLWNLQQNPFKRQVSNIIWIILEAVPITVI